MNKEEIEELAFKDRKELANLNELDLLEIIEFLQLDRKQWINQYSTAHNDYVDLKQENKELKELIDTILNWNIFKNECPMNFGYDEETNEDKAQDVFYKDDDYCENNCNDDYTKCWLKYFKELQKVKGDVKNENNVL